VALSTPFYLIGNMDPCGAVVLIMEKIMALRGSSKNDQSKGIKIIIE
jgi:hypothetical protein